MANDVTVTFKVCDKMAKLLGETSFDMDKGKSEIIRTCILLSIDTIKACPSLVNRIQVEDRNCNNNKVTQG